MRYLWAVLGILLCNPAFADPAWVGGDGAPIYNVGSGATCTSSVTASAGDFLLTVVTSGSPSMASLSLTVTGLTPHQIGSTFTDSGNNMISAWFGTYSSAGGTLSVQATTTNSATYILCKTLRATGLDSSNVAALSYVDKVSTNSFGMTTPLQTGASGTTSRAKELLLGVYGIAGVTGMTAGINCGTLDQQSQSIYGLNTCVNSVSSTGNYTISANAGGGGPTGGGAVIITLQGPSGSTPDLVSFSQGEVPGTGNLTIPAPPSITNGNVLLAGIASFGGTAVTPPAGWSTTVAPFLIGGSTRLTVFQKIASSESGDYLFTGPLYMSGSIINITNNNTSTPVDATGATFTGTGTTATGKTVTTILDNSFVVYFCASEGTGVIGIPSGFSQTGNLDGSGSVEGYSSGLVLQPSHGASGDKTAATQTPWGTVMVSVRPTGGAPPAGSKSFMLLLQ